MKLTPPLAGLAQASGLALYVFGVVTLMSSFERIGSPDNEVLIGMTMLLLFVLSATICASIMFGYPVLLFRDGKLKQSLAVVGWSIGWLALIFGVTLTIALAT